MRWLDGPAAVRVPATSANLGPGFDSFGLALTLHDTVEARVIASGIQLDVIGMGSGTAQAGEQHLVLRAMRAGFDAAGAQPAGIALSCRNAIPHGFGLGSSAAAILAGLLLARALASEEGAAALPDAEVLTLATELEGHPDNVAACMVGGLTVAWQSGSRSVSAARMEPLADLAPVVCVPTSPLATEVARKVLPASVPHADAAANSARTALLIAGLTSQPELLLAGTEDFLHQRYRADSMPATTALIAELRAAGIPAAVSGAGPSVLALPVTSAQAEAVGVLAVGADTGADWQVLPLSVDTAGAQLVSPADE